MKNIFCTILSKLRVYQGVVLQRSLIHNSKDSSLYILCTDDEAYEVCKKMNLTNTELVHISQIEDEKLLKVKNERAINEYCWTLKPFFIEFVMRQKKWDFVTYIDADMCFFNDPAPIYMNQENSTVLLSEHDYFDLYKRVEKSCGKYNSGLISFRNNEEAMAPLKWWQSKCLEWCYDMARDGKFGDQKYLDEMPILFSGVTSIKTPGVNIAPWNEAKYRFKIRNEEIYINENKLICYHFSGFRIVEKNKVALLSGSKKIYDIIHFPYMSVLKRVIMDVEQTSPYFRGYSIEQKFMNDAKYVNL